MTVVIAPPAALQRLDRDEWNRALDDLLASGYDPSDDELDRLLSVLANDLAHTRL